MSTPVEVEEERVDLDALERKAKAAKKEHHYAAFEPDTVLELIGLGRIAKLLANIVATYGKTFTVAHLLLAEGRVKEAHEWIAGPLVENGMLPEDLTDEERAAVDAYAKLENTQLTWPAASPLQGER